MKTSVDPRNRGYEPVKTIPRPNFDPAGVKKKSQFEEREVLEESTPS